MNNKRSIYIGIIIVILAVVILVNTFKENKEEANSKNVTNTSNIAEENKIANDTVENKVANNEVENNTTSVVEDQTLETADFTNTVYESNSDAGTTDKKQEAIDLVKNQWGEDDTVTFSCDSITSDGIYIIAVTSKEKAEVLSYFRVDLTEQTVTIDY